MMTKVLATALTLATVSTAAIVTTPAAASDAGAFIAGAIVGGTVGAIAASGGTVHYAPAPVYATPDTVCEVRRVRVMTGHGWRWRNKKVCYEVY